MKLEQEPNWRAFFKRLIFTCFIVFTGSFTITSICIHLWHWADGIGSNTYLGLYLFMIGITSACIFIPKLRQNVIKVYKYFQLNLLHLRFPLLLTSRFKLFMQVRIDEISEAHLVLRQELETLEISDSKDLQDIANIMLKIKLRRDLYLSIYEWSDYLTNALVEQRELISFLSKMREVVKRIRLRKEHQFTVIDILDRKKKRHRNVLLNIIIDSLITPENFLEEQQLIELSKIIEEQFKKKALPEPELIRLDAIAANLEKMKIILGKDDDEYVA